MKKSANQINRGQTISFRIPSDTPDYLLKEIQRLKETERRNFSSRMAELVLKGINETSSKERETITIPLPGSLNKAQRNWIKHEHSEALLGSILYQLLNDPVRATGLLASLNSSSTDIDEALYLQEELPEEPKEAGLQDVNEIEKEHDPLDDDLDSINWEEAVKENRESEDEEVESEEADLDDILGDFLSKMNK
ncbi:hypothetical protein SAMN04487943_103236 [Gracilibacillus orientalis]|uniref:Uncharacterized protein n=1 Tax=Gracilibacillus orientalis TaxID=334253 RepID=A0A1I4JXU9_9BACI|nr:hypothetical protein [Gracilibacillus orientalis]SFL71332.1 hypothetical protein SAMN04487943_103236 [Gracilibacillus orientalis]